MANPMLWTLVAFVLLSSCALGGAAAPDLADIRAAMGKLGPQPRLLLPRGQEAQLKERIAADPELKAVWDLVRRSADAMLDEPPIEHRVVGRRLLAESRRCLRRMTHLGMAYRLTGEEKYVQRAKREMLTAAGFADWNPSHFLDTAEMTAALAIGVDWMHDALDEPTRATIRQAIVEKGLKASLVNPHWAKGSNNWNQVCNAGMILGAIAVAEDEPKLAVDMVARAIEGLPYAMKEYGQDGAYPEGPMYWDYGTTFNVLAIAALQGALGSDFGLLSQPGFARTATYYLHATGPTGLWFNYVDASQRGSLALSPAMSYFATWESDPALLWFERKSMDRLAAKPEAASPRSSDRLLPMLLVWSGAHALPAATPKSLTYIGDGMTPVALFRSSWDDRATFAGIKGGKASGPHGHMDVGTFVIDMMGNRFVDDLGMQDYHSLESIGVNLWDSKQTGDRWKVFRLNAASHNVLMVDGKDHDVNGRGQIVASTPRSAKLDLSPVFAGQLESASRELTLRDDLAVTVADSVKALPVGATVRWACITRAKVTVGTAGALLERNGARVSMRVKGIDAIEVKTRPLDPPPAKYDAPNPGVNLVWFEVAFKPDESRNWQVEFAPAK